MNLLMSSLSESLEEIKMRIRISLKQIAILSFPLIVMIGVSKAQTSSPAVIELETGDITKNIAVAAGVATEGTSKFYLLHNNDARKRSVRIRLTPAKLTGLGIYDQNGLMINENADIKVFNVFDAVLEKDETIKIEIWPVRVKKSQFTLVITDTTAGVETRDEKIPDPHRHRLGENVLADVTSEIKIVDATAPVAKQENIVVNKRGTFSAFTVSTGDGLERIFFTDLASLTHKSYEIRGVAWPNRPLSDPVCEGNFFIFDRSAGPQRSIHYAFDLNKRTIEAARAF
jgi:hypothetical protein